MWRLSLLFVVFSLLLSCKGYREFRENRKELQAEKAERKANQQQEAQDSPEETVHLASADSNQLPDSLFFGLSKTPCFGRCPTYELRLYKGGFSTWRGENNVDRMGDFEANYQQALADSILSYAQRIGFMFLLDNYDNQLVTDLPATVFYLKQGDTPKRIYCRISCPEELGEFAEQVERWSDELEWKKRD